MTTRTERTIDLPVTSPGTQHKLRVVTFGDADARPKIYLQAAIHADETPGIVVLHYLQNLLNDLDARGQIKGHIVLVPMANPYGTGQRVFGHLIGRYSFTDGINFNRGHIDLSDIVEAKLANKLDSHKAANNQLVRQTLKAAADELPASNEVSFLKRTLLSMAIDADYCLDLHCDAEALLHLYSLNSRLDELELLSAQLGCEGAYICDVAGGNPFDEAISLPWLKLAERFPDCPIAKPPLAATVEYRGKSDVSVELATSDANNLIAFMQRVGIVTGEPGEVPLARCKLTPLEGVDHIRAPKAGVVLHSKEVGDHVQGGDIVARILDPFCQSDKCVIEIVTRTSGVVYNRTNQRMVSIGEQIMCVAGERVLDRNPGELLLSD